MAQLEILDGFKESGAEAKSEGKKGNKLTKLFKKKPFLIAVVVVSILGLYAWYKNSKSSSSSSSSEDTTGLLYASGYSYPSSEVYDMSYYEDALISMDESYQNQLADVKTEYEDIIKETVNSYEDKISDVQSTYDTTTEAIVSQVNTLSEKLNTTTNIINEQSEAIAKQNAINQMKQNSDMYHYATTTAQKEALHNANKSIASQWGWTFNDDDGYWYDDTGSKVYQTVTQAENSVKTVDTKKASTVSSASSSSSSSSKSTSTTGTNKSNTPVGGTYVGSDGRTYKVNANGSTTIVKDKSVLG